MKCFKADPLIEASLSKRRFLFLKVSKACLRPPFQNTLFVNETNSHRIQKPKGYIPSVPRIGACSHPTSSHKKIKVTTESHTRNMKQGFIKEFLDCLAKPSMLESWLICWRRSSLERRSLFFYKEIKVRYSRTFLHQMT